MLSLGRLVRLGYDHAAVRREVEVDRWQRLGTHTVALHTGPVSAEGNRWRAVWEVATDVALVDGVSALHAHGLTGFDEKHVHVSVPRGAQCPSVDGVRVHRVTRTVLDESPAGLPRTPPDVAAPRAAWSRVTDGSRLPGRLDVAALRRRYGVPPPERQVVRRPRQVVRTAVGRDDHHPRSRERGRVTRRGGARRRCGR